MPILRREGEHRRMSELHIPGKKSGHIILYTLTTCYWCEKTKELLDDLGVEYDYKYIDLLNDGERDKAIQEVKTWNPRYTFPTLIIDNEKCIVGYRENEIKEALGK
jgi:glutaredoxin